MMQETAGLAAFAHLKEGQRVLLEDSYLDDILTSHNDQKKLVEIVKGLEEILKVGGFSLKAWVWSGQSGRSGSGRINSLQAWLLRKQSYFLTSWVKRTVKPWELDNWQRKIGCMSWLLSIFQKGKKKLKLKTAGST